MTAAQETAEMGAHSAQDGRTGVTEGDRTREDGTGPLSPDWVTGARRLRRVRGSMWARTR